MRGEGPRFRRAGGGSYVKACGVRVLGLGVRGVNQVRFRARCIYHNIPWWGEQLRP